MPNFASTYLIPKKLRFKTIAGFKIGEFEVQTFYECVTPVSTYRIEYGYNDDLYLSIWHVRDTGDHRVKIKSISEGKALAQEYYNNLITSCCNGVEVYVER